MVCSQAASLGLSACRRVSEREAGLFARDGEGNKPNRQDGLSDTSTQTYPALCLTVLDNGNNHEQNRQEVHNAANDDSGYICVHTRTQSAQRSVDEKRVQHAENTQLLRTGLVRAHQVAGVVIIIVAWVSKAGNAVLTRVVLTGSATLACTRAPRATGLSGAGFANSVAIHLAHTVTTSGGQPHT